MFEGFDAADTTWVLISTALVFLMIPGLALFYGGMTKPRSTLNMLMMSFASLAIVTTLWILYGFAFSFGPSDSGFFGAFSFSNLDASINLPAVNGAELTIPLIAFAGFQMMFAAITPALISGAVADRARYLTWGVFIIVWTTIVYMPVAHWVFSFGNSEGEGAGWLASMGVLDFAGGTAVHINAGAAALALAIVVGRRHGWAWRKTKTSGDSTGIQAAPAHRPHNLPLAFLGAALLWFGWFGFNAGSALAVNGLTALVFLNTAGAAAAGAIGWATVEHVRTKRITTLGAVSGSIAGLVAITPACAFVTTGWAIGIGLFAGAICALAVSWKTLVGVDDTLDVVGLHLVGGVVGSLAIGFVATTAVNDLGADGLLYGGGLDLLGKQAVGVVAVGAYSFLITLLLGWGLQRTMGFRVSTEAEVEGVDTHEHAESAYDFLGHRASPGQQSEQNPLMQDGGDSLEIEKSTAHV